MQPRRVIILGSTGSIGTQTLEVIERLSLAPHGPSLRVVGLAAGRNAALLFDQAARHGVRDLALAAGEPAQAGSTLRVGPDAAERLVREVPCDLVVAAMVGVSGLPATLAAVELGRHVALANKETLVAAGDLVVPLARRTGAALLPVDSEHSGVWQCLAGAGTHALPPFACPAGVARVTLTASGGAFRDWTPEQIAAATPADALRHPTWSMGRKVTIDSASLMNKALELIEAHHLFALPASRLGAILHPQSIVHALVEFADGSVVAQLGVPDMRTPIQVALAWPARADAPPPRLDLAGLARLDFRAVDDARYPAVGLALRAIDAGGTSGAILNAANEACVEAFLAGTLRFDRIAPLVGEALAAIAPRPVRTLADVLDADRAARAFVASRH